LFLLTPSPITTMSISLSEPQPSCGDPNAESKVLKEFVEEIESALNTIAIGLHYVQPNDRFSIVTMNELADFHHMPGIADSDEESYPRNLLTFANTVFSILPSQTHGYEELWDAISSPCAELLAQDTRVNLEAVV